MLTVVLLLLVVIGLYNPDRVKLVLPLILPRGIHLPAALMYFMFLAIGLFAGALIAGAGKKGSNK